MNRGLADEPVAAWEVALRPWRAVSAVIGLVQVPLIFSAFVVLIRGDTSAAIWFAAGYGGLEAIKWVLDKAALRRHPEADFEPFYRAAPLRQRDRQLLAFLLLAAPFELLGIGYALTTSFDVDFATMCFLLAAFLVPWAVPLERVRHRDSWLAMTRLPGRPRRRVEEERIERPTVEAARPLHRSVLRWLVIVLLPFVIVAALFLVVALVTR
jgi:hypothetical protein